MGNIATLKPAQPLSVMTDEDMVRVLGASLYPNASHASILMVLGYCKAAGLDPMLKPVHIVPMWDNKAKHMRDVVMPGIAHYRIQASRSGQYVGKSEPDFGPDVSENLGGVTFTYPKWCKVAVRRAIGGVVAEFVVTEYWRENYATASKDSAAPNAMWRKRPYAQLAKCAEAQALRQAFPELIGGQNAAEEMEGRSIEIEAEPVAQAQRPLRPAALAKPRDARAQLDGFANAPAPEPDPDTDDLDVDLPVMPEEASRTIASAWRWFTATIHQLEPELRQAFADEHGSLIAAAAQNSPKYLAAVNGMAAKAGVTVHVTH
ncbi:bet_lambda, phage recombination protein Bet [uncultured Caudovirales phage]|uniref:Bet_lambda, phage recombination protein Bet n=1 Tax=uncultured Caudovirales phage TaxID=2100421 RepID=A0A6J5KP34_9CAUD|nr:bet_lambda, phage recombination protein Bet [uncultured Caudovirales phage]CAB4123611.1 bet_lambda, phage recombination protein Bet [uncultured Caudovirales phage]